MLDFSELERAGVAELADAQDLGSCGVTPVEVQVLSPAPKFAWQLLSLVTAAIAAQQPLAVVRIS